MPPEALMALMQQLTDLEAKHTAQAARLRAPRPVSARQDRPRRAELGRQLFGHIALMCQRVLAKPGLTDGQRIDVLGIARLCKRALEREV